MSEAGLFEAGTRIFLSSIKFFQSSKQCEKESIDDIYNDLIFEDQITFLHFKPLILAFLSIFAVCSLILLIELVRNRKQAAKTTPGYEFVSNFVSTSIFRNQ